MSGKDSYGFTLLEVLVVLAIIAIVSSAVIWNFTPNHNRLLKHTAETLAETLTLAETAALLQSTTYGLSMTSDGWQFYRFDASPFGSKWQRLTKSSFKEYRAPRGVQLRLLLQGQAAAHQIPIIITANGEVTPFKVQLRYQHTKTCYQLMVATNGTIQHKNCDEA